MRRALRFSLFFSSSTSHHKKHPRITESCWQLPSLARKLPRLLESKPWKETRPFARRRKKWARKVKRKEKRCVCRIIFYTKMEKEQRAKEREKEGESVLSAFFSLDLFCFCVVVVVFSSAIFFSYWTQTTRYLLLNAPPRSTTKWFIIVVVVVYVVDVSSSSSSSSREERAKKGKRLEFSSPCVTLRLSLFSFSVAKSNFIIARSSASAS